MVDARKQRYDAKGAIALLEGMRTLVVAKGRKVTRIDLEKDRPDDAALAAMLLGPTGNLRAPAIRIRSTKRGGTMLVGFNAGMFADALDGD